jgi:hypothetical protein
MAWEIPPNLLDSFEGDRDAGLLMLVLLAQASSRTGEAPPYRYAAKFLGWSESKAWTVLNRLQKKGKVKQKSKQDGGGVLICSALEKKTKPKQEKKQHIPGEIDQFLVVYNDLYKTAFRSVEPFRGNFDHWRRAYSLDEMVEALAYSVEDEFWKDKMTPTILFRRLGRDGYPVDRIGELITRGRMKKKPTREIRTGDDPNGLWYA